VAAIAVDPFFISTRIASSQAAKYTATARKQRIADFRLPIADRRIKSLFSGLADFQLALGNCKLKVPHLTPTQP
jgi:hypothetical protein